MVASMSTYDEFIQFGDDQDLFDKWGCNVCKGRAPTDCQGSVDGEVQHEPGCLVPKFLDVMWRDSEREREADLQRRMRGIAATCTCRYIGRGDNDPDGYLRRVRGCPLHGVDPDHALEARRDDATGWV